MPREIGLRAEFGSLFGFGESVRLLRLLGSPTLFEARPAVKWCGPAHDNDLVLSAALSLWKDGNDEMFVRLMLRLVGHLDEA